MTRVSYTIILLFLLGAFGLFHLFSMQFALYWSFQHLDSFMHLAGGFLAGSFGLLLYASSFRRKEGQPVFLKKKLSYSRVFLISLVSALVIGVLWEVYELWSLSAGFYYDIFGIWSTRDTAADILFDVLGGIFSGIFFLAGFRGE